MALNQAVGVMVVYRTGMQAVTCSNADLHLNTCSVYL